MPHRSAPSRLFSFCLSCSACLTACCLCCCSAPLAAARLALGCLGCAARSDRLLLGGNRRIDIDRRCSRPALLACRARRRRRIAALSEPASASETVRSPCAARQKGRPPCGAFPRRPAARPNCRLSFRGGPSTCWPWRYARRIARGKSAWCCRFAKHTGLTSAEATVIRLKSEGSSNLMIFCSRPIEAHGRLIR